MVTLGGVTRVVHHTSPNAVAGDEELPEHPDRATDSGRGTYNKCRLKPALIHAVSGRFYRGHVRWNHRENRPGRAVQARTHSVQGGKIALRFTYRSLMIYSKDGNLEVGLY